MKHYKDNPLLVLGNIVCDFAIVIVSFIVAGIIREWIAPFMRKPFGLYDMWNYLFLAEIMGIVIILINLILGEYRSIHYRSLKAVICRVGIVYAVVVAMAILLQFGIRYNSLSKALLLIFYVLAVFVTIGKKILLHMLANHYNLRHKNAYRVLIVGNGGLAKRCFRELNGKDVGNYHYIGYVGSCQNDKMTYYLGQYEDMPRILNEQQVEQVIVAQDNMDRVTLNRILSYCSVYGVYVRIVPIFNDFLSNLQPSISPNGLLFYDVNSDKTSDILGVRIAITNMSKAVQEITEKLEEWRGKYICISNVHTTVMAHEDANYRKVQNGAVMALPDGGPLSAYSRATGNEEAKRVTGPDLMREILIASGENKWKHFFYGSKQETLDALKIVIEKKYPGVEIVGMISPPFRELTPEEDMDYVQQINTAKPDFVWVGLGAPKQEIWMAAHENRVQALMIGVGAAFDYESGNIKRAPEWMQKMNLEWFYRLLQDPKRLFKRYFVTNLKYLWLTRR